MSDLVYMANDGIDFTKYDFEDRGQEYCYWLSNTKRIIIDKNNNRVYFNNITNEVIVKLEKLFKDKAIYHISKDKIKLKYYKLSVDEWEVIKKMRGKKNEV